VLFLGPAGRDSQHGPAHLLVDYKGGQVPWHARPCELRPERPAPKPNWRDFDAGVPAHLLLPQLIKTAAGYDAQGRLCVQISDEIGETTTAGTNAFLLFFFA
jgi:hypothetical protein